MKFFNNYAKLTTHLLLGILFSISLISSATAQQLGNKQLANRQFVDQWDKPIAINENTKLVIFSHDMDSSGIVKDTLAKLNIADVSAKNWLGVSDISGMPWLITKFVAMPKMRDYPYALALDTEGTITKDWPRTDDQVTVFVLDKGEVQSVQQFATVDELASFLNKY